MECKKNNEVQKNPKYKFINDREACTEDGILIYNLEGYTKSPKNKLRQITKCFESYGKNIKISLIKKHTYLIEFADHQQAAKALKELQHRKSNYTLYVQPCSSWNQPHIKKLIEYLDGNTVNDGNPFENNKSDEMACSISKLNDDCLMEIFKRLDTTDEINLALCCRRFCYIVQAISNFKYRNFNMNVLQTLNHFQIKILGLIIGPDIKELIFHESRFAKCFITYCTNVETLNIKCVKLEEDFLKFLNSKMPNLRKLDINAWVFLEDEKHLKLFKNLKYLKIYSNDITGEYISFLEHLIELSLHDCCNIDPRHFKDICENLRNLQYLDIRGCRRLTSKNFQHLVANLRQLETLKFTNTTENFDCITQLPKLKVLEINGNNGYKEFSNDFFQELIKYQASQLLDLKFFNINLNLRQISFIAELKNLNVLYCCRNELLDDECLQKLSSLNKLQDLNLSNCCGISRESILKLLECCVDLKKLNLVGCQRLPSYLIRNILNLLQKQHEKYLRTNRIHIIVEDTTLFRREVNELTLQNDNDVLNITFEKNWKHAPIDYISWRKLCFENFPSLSFFNSPWIAEDCISWRTLSFENFPSLSFFNSP